MIRLWSLLLCLAFASTVFAQTITRQNLASILGFENGSSGAFPAGWIRDLGATFVDNQVVHGGKYSARIERSSSSSGDFSTITAAIPLDFAGKKIEWRGFLKTRNVNGFVALWLREEGDSGVLEFATLQGLNLHGTMDWKEYSVSIPARAEGKQLYFGFLLSGTGTGWVDDLSLLIDGKPVALAVDRNSVLERDREFDGGSRLNIADLSSGQLKNLVILAKVWGFLKYHHPAVTRGLHHWDYELFRILPRVLNASGRADANAAIAGWIAGFGSIEECTDCAGLDPDDLYLAPDLGWIADESILGADLSRTLQNIYRNRRVVSEQFYVSLDTTVRNPVFRNELDYGSLQLPDSGYQLLALFRYWNIVQYFYPNRNILADDPIESPDYWNDVLEEFIPIFAQALDGPAYRRELMRFIAKINDTHANLWSSIDSRPPAGSCQLPVDVRFVEGRPLILRYNSETAGPASGLLPGDLIEELDGVQIEDLLTQWRPYYADSNEAARLRDFGQYLTRGACGAAAVKVRRGETSLNIASQRVSSSSLDFSASSTHDLPGDAFQMISGQIAYAKIGTMKSADAASYIEAAALTKGLIIDLRNYPSDFPVFALGQLLISAPTDFARFTRGDVTNPGAFYWTEPMRLTPQPPYYSGKIVILVDEVTQSSAEYHAMAFRSAPGAIVLGSTTAGADGNISIMYLPGGLFSAISGLGVFYPDKRPTQRIGIIPDIEVNPTIEGIRAGRDELIERAIAYIEAPERRHPARGRSSARGRYQAPKFRQ